MAGRFPAKIVIRTSDLMDVLRRDGEPDRPMAMDFFLWPGGASEVPPGWLEVVPGNARVTATEVIADRPPSYLQALGEAVLRVLDRHLVEDVVVNGFSSDCTKKKDRESEAPDANPIGAVGSADPGASPVKPGESRHGRAASTPRLQIVLDPEIEALRIHAADDMVCVEVEELSPADRQPTQDEAARHPEHGGSPRADGSGELRPCKCGAPIEEHFMGRCGCNCFREQDPHPIGDKALERASAVSRDQGHSPGCPAHEGGPCVRGCPAWPGSSAGTSPGQAE